MDEHALLSVFGGGLMYGSGDKIVYLFVDAELTGTDKLYLKAYDAIIDELSPYSHWSKSAQDECKQEVLRQTQKYNITVEVNGTVIKRKEK